MRSINGEMCLQMSPEGQLRSPVRDWLFKEKAILHCHGEKSDGFSPHQSESSASHDSISSGLKNINNKKWILPETPPSLRVFLPPSLPPFFLPSTRTALNCSQSIACVVPTLWFTADSIVGADGETEGAKVGRRPWLIPQPAVWFSAVEETRFSLASAQRGD